MVDRPSGDTDEFLEVMRETRTRFVAGFADQLDHLRGLTSGTPSSEQLHALRTVAHRMAGLSGTMGFKTVGAHAVELEALADQALASGIFDGTQAATLIQALGEAFNRDLASPPSWAAPAPATTARPRVLVVEDDDDQRAIVTSYLEKAGFATTGLASGDAVLDTARREKPALVLLDVHLPGMDGYSVCRTLKADKDTRGIAVVFTTTRAALNERLAGLALGADDYLTKPIDMRELLIRANRLVANRDVVVQPDGGPLMTYEDWADTARRAVSMRGAAIAMVRAADGFDDVAATLVANLRRRDAVTAYDRTHLLVLMPECDAARGLELMSAALEGAGDGVHAGVAASSGADDTVARIVAEADDALAGARHVGVRVSLSTAPATASAASAPARTLLLADDDPDVCRIVDAHMRGLGFSTTVAFDGQAAIDALSPPPDVVILDLMMPKMTGFEVLERIAQLDGRKPRAIVLSARGREDDVTRAFDLGADDYMVKPFSPQELGARIGRLLR